MELQTETVFRVVMGVLWVTNAAVRTVFRFRTRDVPKRDQKNPAVERFTVALFTVSHFALMLYVLTSYFDFAHVPLPIGVRWSGVLVLCSAIGLFLWTHLTLGANWSPVVELSEHHDLVTSGPYQFVRHPMYSALFAAAVGWFLVSANWLLGGFHFLALLMLYGLRVRIEETMMLEQFGESYRTYMATTGRLFPRWG